MTTEKHLTGYPSIDKPWLKFYKNGVDKIIAKDESMFQMLERCNKERMNSVALELRTSENDYKQGIQITYKEYIDRIKKTASAIFNTFNTQADEIVPIIIPNLPESRILIYALNVIGATAYPINPMLSVKTFESILSDNHVKTIAVFSEFWEKFSTSILKSNVENIIYLNGLESMPETIKSAGKQKTVISDDVRIITYDNLVNKSQIQDIKPYYRKNHVAVIVGTSGTTGTSKGVCLTDFNLNSLALGQEISDHYREGEKALDILIQSIVYGVSSAHSFGCIGCHTVLIPELITDKIADILCEIKPDCFPGGPVHFINICHSKEFKSGQFPYIRFALSGGATLEKEIEKELNRVDNGYIEKINDKILVRQGYGSSECCGAATINTYGAYKFGSIGIPMANVTVSIFKPGTDEELTYGELGEICVCGDTVMAEYLNNPEETNNVLKLHADGKMWLHQADLGWCDEDGHFFITDRIKNIFMRTGFNVHPSKITERLMKSPYIKDCIVFGVKHPKEQMVPIAFVVLNDNTIDKNEIKAILNEYCILNLDTTDIPYEWFFVSELPRNMGGKIDTKALVDKFKINYCL